MRRPLTKLILAVLILAGLSPLATFANDEPPKITEEGLVLVEDSEWGLVYVLPDADFAVYDQVMMTETFVAFRKNWRRDQNRNSPGIRVTENDMNRIKERLAAEFDSVFREVLEEDDGYPVVDEAGETVMLLRPAIINLDVNAPDTMSSGRTRTYSDHAGEMTIYLEIRDSLTGQLLAKGLDRRADRRDAFMTWQSRVQNTQAARQILRGWATSLREGMDEAHRAAGDAKGE
jgi:hypothetical protein